MKRPLLYCTICSLLFCAATKLSAQEFLIDSLNSIIQQDNLPLKERAISLSRLAEVYSYRDINKAYQTNKKALKIAQSDHNNKDALTFIWSKQISLELRARKDSLASQALDSALLYASGSSPLIHGYALYMKGFLENIMNTPDKAMDSWQQALRYLSEPDGVLYQAGIYYQMYAVFADRNDSLKANMYAKLALHRALQSADPTMIAACWQTTGTNYLDNFFKDNDRRQLDSAIFAYKQSLAIFQQREKWIKNPAVVVLSALNLANIYSEYYPENYLDSAKKNINLALSIAKSQSRKTLEINCYQVISRLYRKSGQFDKAEQALLKGKSLLDSLTPPDFFTAKNIYNLLAQINEIQGDNMEALMYYKQYMVFYKKVFDANQFKTIQQLEAKYQTAQKEEKLGRLQQKTIFQTRQTRLYIIIGLIAIIGLLALFLAYRFRFKYALQREKLKDEQAARLLAEQNLMQNQKEQLQKELLAGALQVEHKNEVLRTLKEKLLEKTEAKPAKVQLEKIINEEMRMDEGFEGIRAEFKDLHPAFFNLLQEKANSKLTALDLKYCAYFYMKLPTKQIASLLNVEAKSVRMSRYRIKQKLGLGKEEELDTFLQEFKAWKEKGSS